MAVPYHRQGPVSRHRYQKVRDRVKGFVRIATDKREGTRAGTVKSFPQSGLQSFSNHLARIEDRSLLAELAAQSAASQAHHQRGIDGSFLGNVHEVFGHHRVDAKQTAAPFAEPAVYTAPLGAKLARSAPASLDAPYAQAYGRGCAGV